jgi:predicted ferric reductase
MNQEVKNMLHKFDLISAIIGMMIAIAVSVVVVNIKYEGYRQVHQTNIGGVVIEGKHIYELVELSDPSQGVIRK